jgi:hypothetical protein
MIPCTIRCNPASSVVSMRRGRADPIDASTRSTKCGASVAAESRVSDSRSARAAVCTPGVIHPRAAIRSRMRAWRPAAASGRRHGLKRDGCCGSAARNAVSARVSDEMSRPKYACAARAAP